MTKRKSNLIPNSERTPSERRKIARSGGLASGAARRERSSLRKELTELLDIETDCPDGTRRTLKERISLALIEKAISGDVAAFKVIRETIGEDVPEQEKEPTEKATISFGNMPPELILQCILEVQENEKREKNEKGKC